MALSRNFDLESARLAVFEALADQVHKAVARDFTGNVTS
jgi:hypothetical protein